MDALWFEKEEKTKRKREKVIYVIYILTFT